MLYLTLYQTDFSFQLPTTQCGLGCDSSYSVRWNSIGFGSRFNMYLLPFSHCGLSWTLSYCGVTACTYKAHPYAITIITNIQEQTRFITRTTAKTKQNKHQMTKGPERSPNSFLDIAKRQHHSIRSATGLPVKITINLPFSLQPNAYHATKIPQFTRSSDNFHPT